MTLPASPPRLWRVEHDPEGVFRGRFTLFDLKYTARMGNWPEGITFRNIRTGKRARYLGGALYIDGRVAARTRVCQQGETI